MKREVSGALWVMATLVGVICSICGVLAIFGYAMERVTSQLAP